MNKSFKLSLPFFIMLFIVMTQGPLTYAQLSDETREQREFANDDRRQELEAARERKAMSAEEILELLKEKAEEKIREKRRKELTKMSYSAGLTLKHETNPASDSAQKGDESNELTASANWQPTFTKELSGDLGYTVTDTNYARYENLNTANHSFTGKVKYYPFKDNRKFSVSPGTTYEWNIYPFDDASSYEQFKAFADVTHYFGKLWSWGGKYDYNYKVYDKKVARDFAGTNLNFHREDNRHNGEIWIKRQFGKVSVRFKEKSYRNTSNDNRQKFNDYYSHRGYITISGSFLEDGKLYVNYTSDYESKTYDQRPGDDGGSRFDNAIQHKMTGNLTLNKIWTWNNSFTYKKNGSNVGTGSYKNATISTGLTANFQIGK